MSIKYTILLKVLFTEGFGCQDVDILEGLGGNSFEANHAIPI